MQMEGIQLVGPDPNTSPPKPVIVYKNDSLKLFLISNMEILAMAVAVMTT